MEKGNFNLNPSSLIDLKAELQKKYEVFNKEKLAPKPDISKRTPFKNKGEPPKEKRTKTVVTLTTKDEDVEEEIALKKSRAALEAKSKLYEEIMSSSKLIDDEENESYLVDFQRKVLYQETSDKNQNVEKNIESANDNYSKVGYSYAETSFEKAQKYSDQSKVNEAFKDDLQGEQSVHYQNIQNNEVRDHGTGYFAFSTNEAKRKEQMEELKSLRKQTEDSITAKRRLEERRKAALQARLAKVCERRNIDQSVVETYAKNPEIEEEVVLQPELDTSSIPLPEEIKEPEKKKTKVRPWDIGKNNLQFFVPEKKKIKTQREWVDERRDERLSEFAPPSTYAHKR